MLSLDRLTLALRATAEPTRLRLLALCAEREIPVSELASLLGQSEPRVSRHLKILCSAGLLVRSRRGQWVRYRAAGEGDAGALVSFVLSRLDRGDRTLRRDRERAEQQAPLQPVALADTRAGRAAAGFLLGGEPGASGRGRARRLLLVTPRERGLVEASFQLASHVTLVAGAERREALATLCEETGAPYSLRETLPPLAEGPYDIVVVDASHLEQIQQLEATLESLRGNLATAARLCVVVPYGALESARGNVIAHPLAELRGALARTGFATTRLKPIENGASAWLAALAQLAPANAVAREGVA